MITSEKLSLLSLRSRCSSFRSTCASITAVVATRDALIVKCLSVWKQPVGKDHSLMCTTPRVPDTKDGVHQCLANVECSPTLPDAHAHLCVHAQAQVWVFWHPFSTFADKKSRRRKEQRAKGRALCFVQFPPLLKSHSPDVLRERIQTKKCVSLQRGQKLWQVLVIYWWQG